MRKQDLIAALNHLPGNPEIFMQGGNGSHDDAWDFKLKVFEYQGEIEVFTVPLGPMEALHHNYPANYSGVVDVTDKFDPMNDLLIWWTNQEQAKLIHDMLISHEVNLPYDVWYQFNSRFGRSGRGRLWSDDPSFGINPWPDTSLAKELGENYGGIVFKKHFFENVKKFPGVITDNKLNELFRM